LIDYHSNNKKSEFRSQKPEALGCRCAAAIIYEGMSQWRNLLLDALMKLHLGYHFTSAQISIGRNYNDLKITNLNDQISNKHQITISKSQTKTPNGKIE
jgi:hypothetical protein